MLGTRTRILCEITSSDGKLRHDLARIARTCAVDLKIHLPLEMLERSSNKSEPKSEVALSIPADFALANDSIWKLAFRISCFCPQTRITTQINSTMPYKSLHNEASHS